MSIVKKRSDSRRADFVAEDEEMSAAISICVEIVVAAVAIYVLGLAML